MQHKLHVEGANDLHSILGLMTKYGFDFSIKPYVVELMDMKSIEKLIRGIDTAIMLGTGSAIGFVLDADDDPQARWHQVCHRLEKVQMTPPSFIPSEGYIDECAKHKCRVGVWMMPDNQRQGALEHFLQNLIEHPEPLLRHAQESASEARQLGAQFREVDLQKATLHTWLAWQSDPGMPYGMAIKATFFRHDLPAGIAFAAWFKRLFGIAAKPA